MAHTERGRVVWPGEEVPCPAGCRQYPPLQAPHRPSRHRSGCWGALCRSCGRMLFLRPHYGDREEDLCWVVEDDVPAGMEDVAQAMAEYRQCLWRAEPVGSDGRWMQRRVGRQGR